MTQDTAASTRTLPATSVRGVYLWAGNATVDLQRAKFPDRAVDEDAHAHANTAHAAGMLAGRGFTWAFLSMNWGFPPEHERAHWEEYERAAAVYRAAGIRVIGYVQASNCLASGSYADRDWYAVTPRGRRVPYFRNRLMTCWNHAEWIEEVGAHVVRAMELGGEGVFLDNMWMGATPWMIDRTAGGFAGCACTRCRTSFERSSEFALPLRLEPDDASAAYLAWRSSVVRQRLAEWSDRVRTTHPGAIVVTNSCDAALRDTHTLFGQTLGELAPLQDAVLVENVAMPRHEPRRARLVANALPLKAVLAVVRDRPVLSVTYQHGIGLDKPPSAALLRRAAAEAAAVGAAPVLKGSEYLDDQRRFTVITAPALRPALDGVAPLLRWLALHPQLFDGASAAPLVNVLYDEQGMQTRWGDTASGTFATALALVRACLPFAFVTEQTLRERDIPDVPLIIPPGLNGHALLGGSAVIALEPEDLNHARRAYSVLARPGARRLADAFLGALSRGYFGSARVRRLVDATGATRRFLESPFFRYSRSDRIVELCGVTPPIRPSLLALVERWRLSSGAIALHIVNYADEPNRIEVPDIASAHLHTPDEQTAIVQTAGKTYLELSTYAVLEWTPHENHRTWP